MNNKKLGKFFRLTSILFFNKKRAAIFFYKNESFAETYINESNISPEYKLEYKSQILHFLKGF